MVQTTVLMQLRNAFCERGDRVLFKNVDLQLSRGDLFHLEGLNGAGKTTLLRSIVGLFSNVQGELKWFLPLGVESSRWMVSFWGHHLGMNLELSVIENLRWSVGLRRKVTEEACKDALAVVGLRGFESAILGELSAGQRQRAGMVRLILEQMPVWILDEPLNALDSSGIRFFEERLAAHVHRGGCVLMTSHQALAIANIKSLTLTKNGLVNTATGERHQWS